MPDATTVQSRQRTAVVVLIAIPIVIFLLYLVPVSVQGRVTDFVSGQPMANVLVQLENGEQFRSDAEGRFSTRALRFGGIKGTADLDRYQPWEGKARFPIVPLLAARMAVDLNPTRLAGVIVDASDQTPVAGAMVAIAGETTASDDSGRFEVLRLPAGPSTFQAEAEGFIDYQEDLRVAREMDGAQPKQVLMLPNGLRGTVRDAVNGEPVAGVNIDFEGKAVQSDGQGIYYVSHVADAGELQASLTGYLPATIAVESEDYLSGEEPLDVDLEPTVLAGQALDERSGEPIAGVRVEVGGQSMTTDDGGRFRFERLHGSGLVLSAARSGYDPQEQPVSEAGHLLGGRALNVTMTPKSLAGEVFNEVTNSPLAGATAIAGDRTAVSDEQGRFVLWGVEPPTTIFISAEGFFDGEGQYPDTSEQRISLKPRHAVVTVEDQATGERLVGVPLRGPRSESVTDAQGVALLRLLDPGDEITVAAEGYAPVAISYDGADQITVTTYRDTVAGQIVDGESGSPVAGAKLYVYDGDTCQGEACRGTTPVVLAQVETDGSFVVDGLPPNPQVMIKAPGYDLFFPEALEQGECGSPFCLQADMTPFEARGIYIPFGALESPPIIRERLDFIANTPALNAVVIDMKDEYGNVAWEPEYPLARELGIHNTDAMSAQEFLELARARDIYTIARFVTFQDRALAEGRLEWAARRQSDPYTVWYEGDKAYVDPYRKEVREYEIALAKELAELGFDEVQFDYFRFSGQDHSRFIYSVPSTTENRIEAITTFAQELKAALEPTGTFTSLDIFGSPINVGQEPFIGQSLSELGPSFDYLSPMIYPQVWRTGDLAQFPADPVFYPYELINYLVERVRVLVPDGVRIRPWLQGYPNNYRSFGYDYSVPEYMMQRRAAEDADSDGWLFWSGGGNFAWETFGPMPSLEELRAQVSARQQAVGSLPPPVAGGGS